MNHRRNWIIVATLFLTVSISSAQPAFPGKEARHAEYLRFISTKGAGASFEWDHRRGIPKSMSRASIRVPNVDANNPRAVAEAFFQQEKGMFGIDGISRKLVHEHTNHGSTGKTYLMYKQLFKGVPILDRGYTIAVRSKDIESGRRGDIDYFHGSVYPDISIDVSPTLSTEEVETLIQRHFGREFVTFQREPFLSIYVDNSLDELARLVYTSIVETAEDAVHVSFDAHSGLMVRYVSLTANHRGRASESSRAIESTTVVLPPQTKSVFSCGTSPCGRVYDHEPYNAANTDSSEQQLSYLEGNDELDGREITVRKGTKDTGSIAQAVNGDFLFPLNSWQGEHTNVYYHLMRALSVLLENPEEKIQVVTHAGDVRAFPDITLPYTDSYIKLASEDALLENSHYAAATLVHEYWHVIVAFHNTHLASTTDGQAMSEGFSDFAGIYYRSQSGWSSTVMGQYLDKPDQNCEWERDITDSNDYEDYRVIPDGDYDACFGITAHDGGMLMGSTIWKFFELNSGWELLKLGVFREGVMALDPNPTIPQMYAAMQGTDECGFLDTQGDDCTGDLQTAFCYNNIDEHSGYSCVGAPKAFLPGVDQAPADSELPQATSIVGNYPNPFNSEATVEYQLHEGGPVSLRIVDTLGRLVQTLVNRDQPAGIHRVHWDGRDLAGQLVASGSYIYRLRVGSAVDSRVMILAR